MSDLGTTLLRLARDAIALRLGELPPVLGSEAVCLPELGEPGATFVTLMQDDRLRGCIGTLTPERSLAEDVCQNACDAAFRDPRFAPLRIEEWSVTRVEVSLLSLPQPLCCKDEADALAQLRPGIDGVIFVAGSRRATFLPQVWEQLPVPSEFLAYLKRKAGVPAGYWGPDVQLQRYEVLKWKETSR